MRRLRKRAIVLAVTGVLASAGIVAATGSPALADGWVSYQNCSSWGNENNPYTDVDEQEHCDLVQARTYTYIGGGQTTTTYGSQHVSYSIAYKSDSGSYSGGAGRVRYNGTWRSWVEL